MSNRATTIPALIEALATRILWLDRNKHHHLNNHKLGIFRDNSVDPATLQELTELGYTISVEGFPLIFGDLRRNTDLKARVGELQRKTLVLLSMMDNRAMRKWNGYWDQPGAADVDTDDEGVTDQAAASSEQADYYSPADTLSTANEQAVNKGPHCSNEYQKAQLSGYAWDNYRQLQQPISGSSSCSRSSSANELSGFEGMKKQILFDLNRGGIRQSPANKLFRLKDIVRNQYFIGPTEANIDVETTVVECNQTSRPMQLNRYNSFRPYSSTGCPQPPTLSIRPPGVDRPASASANLSTLQQPIRPIGPPLLSSQAYGGQTMQQPIRPIVPPLLSCQAYGGQTLQQPIRPIVPPLLSSQAYGGQTLQQPIRPIVPHLLSSQAYGGQTLQQPIRPIGPPLLSSQAYGGQTLQQPISPIGQIGPRQSARPSLTQQHNRQTHVGRQATQIATKPCQINSMSNHPEFWSSVQMPIRPSDIQQQASQPSLSKQRIGDTPPRPTGFDQYNNLWAPQMAQPDQPTSPEDHDAEEEQVELDVDPLEQEWTATIQGQNSCPHIREPLSRKHQTERQRKTVPPNQQASRSQINDIALRAQSQISDMAERVRQTQFEYDQWLNELDRLSLNAPNQPNSVHDEGGEMSISDINQAYTQQMAHLMNVQSDMSAKVAELRRRYEEVMTRAGVVQAPEPVLLMEPQSTHSSILKSDTREPAAKKTVSIQRNSRSKAKKSKEVVSSTEVSSESDVSDTDTETGDSELSSDGYVTDIGVRQQMVMVQQPAIKVIKAKEDDIVDWFDEFEKVASAQGWDRKTMVKQAPLYFKGQAESVWKRMGAADKRNYKVLKEYMLKKLKMTGDAATINDYNSLAQLPGESPAELAERLERLVNRSRKLRQSESESSRARTFVKALRLEIGSQLVNERFKNIEAALKKAERIDSFLDKKSQEEVHHFAVNALQLESSHTSQQYSYQPPRQNQIGIQFKPQQQPSQHQILHQQSQQHRENIQAANSQHAYNRRQETDGRRQKQQNQTTGNSQRTCFYCKQLGHWVRQCPLIDWEQLRDYVCSFCYARGHPEELCMVVARRQSHGVSSNSRAPQQETQGPGFKPSSNQ